MITEFRDSLRNLVANIGTTKDKRYYNEWVRKKFGQDELSTMYREDWLTGKIVDITADDMTRKWRIFKSGDSTPENLKLLKDAESAFKLQLKVNEAIKWARLYGGSAIIMGIDGAGRMNEPLRLDRVRPGSLKYLLVLDRHDLFNSGLINTSNPEAESFRSPEFYRINGGSEDIHYSRVIPFYGVKLPWKERQKEQYWGQSIIQRVFDAIMNSQTVAQSVSSMTFEAKLDIVKVKNLFRMISNKKDETAMLERFRLGDLMKSLNNMLIVDMDEEDYVSRQLQFAGLSDLIMRFLNIAAAAADIPATRLLGESAPGLNATGAEQTRQYYDMVSSQQEMVLRPCLDKIDQVIVRSTLGNYPEDLYYEFKSLWQMTEVEKADVELKRARRDSAHLASGNITSSIATKQLKEDGTYPIEDEFIEALEEIETGKYEEEIAEEPEEQEVEREESEEPGENIDQELEQ